MHRERENLRSAIPSGTYFSAYGMRPPIERQFRRRGVLRLGPANSGVVSFDTADQALQDAEAQVLRESGRRPKRELEPLGSALPPGSQR